MKHKLQLLTFLILAIHAQAMCSAADLAQRHPNIVFIMVDDMGYGDPGCFNAESKIPTPNIDGLAADGMRFTDAHAPGPLCHMSRYGLLTGRYPFRTNVGRWRNQPVIEDGQTTIASLLQTNGYHTAMVGKWHLGFAENGYDKPLPGGPVDRGFDSYFGIRASTDIPPYFYIRDDQAVDPPTDLIEARSTEGWSPIQGEFWRAGGIAPGLELKDVLPRFTDEALRSMTMHALRDTNQPLFLYLAYPAPHTPWLPSEEFRGKSGAGMYGEFAMMVDAEIGRVLHGIKKDLTLENTLIVFTSDNGPVWYETDVERFGHDSSGGLRGMKADAWECGHRMPFIAKWPGNVKAGTTSHQTICFTDMLATFADIVDTTLPQDAGPDSFSILPILRGEQDSDHPIRDALLMQSGNGTMTIRSGDWKLITALGSGGFSDPRRIKPGEGDPPGQLYNLAQDLGETKNVYQDHPEVVARLTRRMVEVRDTGRHRMP